MKLSELKNGQSAIIMKVNGYGGFRKRIMEMGFVRGKKVTPVLNAPLNDPVKYDIMGYEVSLRKSEASMIEVFTGNEGYGGNSAGNTGTTEDNDIEREYDRKGPDISIALVGNPNCGKPFQPSVRRTRACRQLQRSYSRIQKRDIQIQRLPLYGHRPPRHIRTFGIYARRALCPQAHSRTGP